MQGGGTARPAGDGPAEPGVEGPEERLVLLVDEFRPRRLALVRNDRQHGERCLAGIPVGR
ncbi:hypothetical protein [Halocatena salina]|uniref:Uncharacterized protein n=1 Tax=Halocatena salina TaxID=2934340 RepID=A0A8U0ABJ4_9EURY|nr:hypothetical protein [Halocatena salina]UPM45243.1 hypothetical protein MW046_19015 [Halocatena salina]